MKGSAATPNTPFACCGGNVGSQLQHHVFSTIQAQRPSRPCKQADYARPFRNYGVARAAGRA
jgi:hypothetical protein